MAVVFDRDYKLIDGLTPETIKDVQGNMLEVIFEDGDFKRVQPFDEIRKIVAKESLRVDGGKF